MKRHGDSLAIFGLVESNGYYMYGIEVVVKEVSA